MTKIITCAKLRHRRLEELQAPFRSLEIAGLGTLSGQAGGKVPDGSELRRSGSQETRRWRKGDSNPRSP
jgi:hypothetical protein